MIKLLAKKKNVSGLTLMLLMGCAKVAYSVEADNFSNATHPYASYKEFAASVCLPCHYRNIPNGTDLQKLYPNTSEAEIKSLLLLKLKDGNMPPDETYRKILYNKFLQIK